jgi:uracil-DNA glycosylase
MTHMTQQTRMCHQKAAVRGTLRAAHVAAGRHQSRGSVRPLPSSNHSPRSRRMIFGRRPGRSTATGRPINGPDNEGEDPEGERIAYCARRNHGFR